MATKKPTAAPAVARPRVGVYATHNRDTAIVVKLSESGVWYLTMRRGWIEVVHVGDEKFTRDFPMVYAGYPLLRALKAYANSGLRCDDDAAKVMQRLIERL